MFRKLGSSGSLWRPKNPHSLEYLKYLHGVLLKNDKVTDSNRKILVEALRAMAEILIWGDQNDASVFDFFLEKQMLLHFLKIMGHGSSTLNVQLLQTLNILFENIRHETSLYFLLSNNHVNSIISHKFDLSNDEIMAYYISFLKTMSFKLNACTIHFFFNETTNEFPLLMEALNLFDSNESMVRIAVRNIVLNIVRVEDDSMAAFVKTHTELYLGDLVDNLVASAISMDNFVRSAENVQANRERLRDKVDDLVDLIHYIGELIDVQTVADTLSNLLTRRFVMPLLLNSISPRRNNQALLLTPVSSLFFFSQILLIISHRKTIQTFLTAFFFDDPSTLVSHWTRSGESFCLQAAPSTTLSEDNRVFFEYLLMAFDSSQKDDYLPFYGLMMIYAMFQNKADVTDLLQAAHFPVASRSRLTSRVEEPNPTDRKSDRADSVMRARAVTELGEEVVEEMYHDVVDHLDALKAREEQLDDEVLIDEPRPSSTEDERSTPEEARSRFESATDGLTPSPRPEEINVAPSTRVGCDKRIMDALAVIIDAVSKEECAVRPLTLELTCLVVRQILMIVEDEQLHVAMTSLCSRVRTRLVELLSLSANTETLFLEWFEDEYAEFEVNHVKLDIIAYEMLIPPAYTPMSGLPLHKRLSSGFEERVRTLIIYYLHIRKLERDLTGEHDNELPVSVTSDQQPLVALGDCINLNNSDLLMCTVIPQQNSQYGRQGDRLVRFLVTDRLQLILVEPDSRKAGWAIVRFVGLLQDTQINGDSSDSRALHVVVEGQPSRIKKRQTLLSAKFLFDDHIRCMAAKQRLTKGRQQARNLKLQAICNVIGVHRVDPQSQRVNPFRILKGCAPGSVRKTVSTSSSTSSSRRTVKPVGSNGSIPDDPSPAATSSDA